MPAEKWKKIGTSSTSPTNNKKRKEVKTKVPKTENIIFIGSEMQYDSFWLKMMFIASAVFFISSKKIRPAHKKTLAYVDNDYTYLEKLALDVLKINYGFEIVKLTSSSDIISLLNKDRENYKIQDTAFFSHGIVNAISLNYNGKKAIDFRKSDINKVKQDAFTKDGKLYSYACRTGVSVEDYKMGFENEAAAQPENSLAQKIADYFDIEVHAFLRRSFYGNVIRNKSDSDKIANTLKKERDEKEGQVIDIPPEHEALPHDGLANSWHGFGGPEREGTNDYALWRKEGGLGLPTAAETPKGLPKNMRIFTKSKPKQELIAKK